MKRLRVLLLCLCLAGPVCGQGVMPPPQPAPPAPQPLPPAPGVPYVQLPHTASGQPGAFVVIASNTNGKEVVWYTADAGLQLFPAELLKSSKTAIVTASQAGTFKLVAFTALGDQIARSNECLITIGQPGPVPPGPVPPGPTPPPAPIPDLQKTLQAAFDRDDDSDKAESAKILTAIYRKASSGVEAAGLSKLGEADAWVRDASFIALGGIRLPSTREAVGRYMKEANPGKATDPFDAAAKGRFKASCEAVATALGGVR